MEGSEFQARTRVDLKEISVLFLMKSLTWWVKAAFNKPSRSSYRCSRYTQYQMHDKCMRKSTSHLDDQQWTHAIKHYWPNRRRRFYSYWLSDDGSLLAPETWCQGWGWTKREALIIRILVFHSEDRCIHSISVAKQTVAWKREGRFVNAIQNTDLILMNNSRMVSNWNDKWCAAFYACAYLKQSLIKWFNVLLDWMRKVFGYIYAGYIGYTCILRPLKKCHNWLYRERDYL